MFSCRVAKLAHCKYNITLLIGVYMQSSSSMFME